MPTDSNPRDSLPAWDLPVRLFHWTLVMLLVVSVVTGHLGGNLMKWHMRSGYAILALLLFRLAWGVFGSPTSSRNAFDRSGEEAEAAADLRWAMQNVSKNNTDVYASWTGNFFDRRWRVDATAGLHDERYHEGSPESGLDGLNQVDWHNTSLY